MTCGEEHTGGWTHGFIQNQRGEAAHWEAGRFGVTSHLCTYLCVLQKKLNQTLRFGFLSCKLDIMMHFSLDFKGLMSVYKLLSIIEVSLLPSVDQKNISS